MEFNPLLAESEFVHRVAVDRLKWELGAPPPGWLPPPPTVYNPRYYHYYYYGYPYGYPAAANEYHYGLGYRDGLKSASGSQSCAAPPPAAATAPPAAASKCPAPTDRKAQSSKFAGDLMEFPSASYRRTLSAFPVSADTSYDNLSRVWPFGCSPFYFRPADPPSVRYCL